VPVEQKKENHADFAKSCTAPWASGSALLSVSLSFLSSSSFFLAFHNSDTWVLSLKTNQKERDPCD
jgi:hypothetical protein